MAGDAKMYLYLSVSLKLKKEVNFIERLAGKQTKPLGIFDGPESKGQICL
jgi:hypothetical protein